jgi:hypothetical protein
MAAGAGKRSPGLEDPRKPAQPSAAPLGDLEFDYGYGTTGFNRVQISCRHSE